MKYHVNLLFHFFTTRTNPMLPLHHKKTINDYERSQFLVQAWSEEELYAMENSGVAMVISNVLFDEGDNTSQVIMRK